MRVAAAASVLALGLLVGPSVRAQEIDRAGYPAAVLRAGRLSDFEALGEETFAVGDRGFAIARFGHRPTGLVFHLVPGGRVRLGSPLDAEGRLDGEGPPREVVVEPFLICRTETTGAAWEAISSRLVDGLPCGPPGVLGLDRPVSGCSFEDVGRFLAATGLRLPTGDEWEHAARAGATGRYAFGDDAAGLERFGHHFDSPGIGPVAVGSRLANAFGLVDVHGNVWEWTTDADVAGRRLVRGGDSIHGAWSCRLAYRFPVEPAARSFVVQRTSQPGFRAARSLVEVAPTLALSEPETPGPTEVDLEGLPAALARARALDGFEEIERQTYACGGREFEMSRFRHRPTGLVFHLIPGGRYSMGTPLGQTWRRPDEGPLHRVEVEPFLIAATEFAAANWRHVASGAAGDPPRGNTPHRDGSWTEVGRVLEGLGLRLPSEAEWEYAARAGTTSIFFFGDDRAELDRYGWVRNGQPTSWPPEGRPGYWKPNAFGLHDMLGNVWEFCADSYHPDYRGAPADGSAWVAARSTRVVVRGGALGDPTARLRPAGRGWAPAELDPERLQTAGVRPARSLGGE